VYVENIIKITKTIFKNLKWGLKMFKKKKVVRSICIVLIIMIHLIVMLSGCTSPKQKQSDVSNLEKEEKQIVMRLSHAFPNETNHGRNALYFKKIVEEYTNDRIKVELYPNAQVGSLDQELRLVIAGDIEASYNLGGVVETIDPAEAIYQIPFLVKSAPGDGAMELAMSENDKIEGVLRERQAKLGYYRLGNMASCFGFFILANNVRPMENLTDANGLKIRTSGGMMGNMFLESLGCSPITIASPEVSVALTQGVIEGNTTHIAHFHDMRWHTKYLTLPYWTGYSHPIMVNLEWWNKLPEDLKDIMINEVMPEVKRYAWEEGAIYDLKSLKECQEEPFNVKVITLDLDAPDVKEWMNDLQQQGIKKFKEAVGEDADIMVKETLRLSNEFYSLGN